MNMVEPVSADLDPSLDEIATLIARTEYAREKWRGNAEYARSLDIELHALHMLALHRRVAALLTSALENSDVAYDIKSDIRMMWCMTAPVSPYLTALRAIRRRYFTASVDEDTRQLASELSEIAETVLREPRMSRAVKWERGDD